MDFFGTESEKEKQKEIELMKNGSNSKSWIQARANESAADTNYHNNGSKSDHDINIKNAYLDPRNNYFREKGSQLSAELKLGMAIDQERLYDMKGSYSSSKSVGRAKLAVSEFIPRLDLSVVGSGSDNPIDLFANQSGFGSPIEVLGEFDHRTSSGQEYGFLRLGKNSRFLILMGRMNVLFSGF